MQHIPVVSHALWRGTCVLKMLDVVPTIQTPGSYHRQDWCLFTVGKSLTGLGSGEGRWGVERLRFPNDFNGGERFWRACEWHLLTYRDNCAWICWPLPGSVHLEKIQGVGGSTVVPLYIQWVGPRLSPTPWLIQRCHLSLFTSHHTPSTPPDPACKLPILSCSCIWPGAWQKDGQQSKDFIPYTNSSSMLSNHYLPKN